MIKNAITSQEMKAIEINAEYYGISLLQLMEAAGRNVAEEIFSRYDPKDTKIAIFCGLGGNGGDGFVAARYLICLGFNVQVILASSSSRISHESAKKNWLALQPIKDIIDLTEIKDSAQIPDIKADVVVDALLGTGTKGKLRSPMLQLVQKINSIDAFCVAVDVPTGVNSDSGEVLGEAVKSDLTITFYKEKKGILKNNEYTGEIIVKNIGLPYEFEQFVGPGDVSLAVKSRSYEAHKGDFGRLLVIGGSKIFSGAPTLAAMAALRTGVDIVTVASPEKTAYAISSMSPALITLKLKGKHLNSNHIPVLKNYLDSASAVVLGPGLGIHEETKEAVKEIIKELEDRSKPILLDADGLKAFAEFKRKVNCPMVLTPHSTEYEIFSGSKLPKNLEDKKHAIQSTAQEFGVTILLKGPIDLISDGESVKLNFTGNPGMTVGGTGDVLSGIVGGLMAMGATPMRSSIAGAFINGAAGDFVAMEKGYHIIPTDILDWIPHIMDDPMCHLEVRRNQK